MQSQEKHNIKANTNSKHSQLLTCVVTIHLEADGQHHDAFRRQFGCECRHRRSHRIRPVRAVDTQGHDNAGGVVESLLDARQTRSRANLTTHKDIDCRRQCHKYSSY